MYQIKIFQRYKDGFSNDVLVTPKNHGTISNNRHVVPRKGKASMRDYSKMTNDEFKKEYLKPYTDEERGNRMNTARKEIKNGKSFEFTDDVIDELFAKYE